MQCPFYLLPALVVVLNLDLVHRFKTKVGKSKFNKWKTEVFLFTLIQISVFLSCK